MAVAGFGEIAEQLRRSTVLVGAGRGNGSGIIWTRDGVIVTNAHVARGSTISVELWDGRKFDAAVTSRDPQRDLAALRVKATNLPAAVIADSSRVRAGELAIAVGNPFGFVGALSTGVVHGVGPIRGLGPQSWVQATVRLAPGNSGGPLADAQGRVIGVNSMAAGGLALAISSNTVASFLSADPADGWLGITVYPVQVPRSSNHDKTFGLVLLEVESGSPAASASLLPGDILLGTEGKPFALFEDLSRALRGSGPRNLRLEFLRGDYGRIRRVTLQLGSQTAGKGFVAA